MKKTLLITGLASLFIFVHLVSFAIPPTCIGGEVRIVQNRNASRTYQAMNMARTNCGFRVASQRASMEKTTRTSGARLSSEKKISVSREQFLSHLESGKNRVLLESNVMTKMDVGKLDTIIGDFQSWQLPDLQKFSPGKTNMLQLSPDSSGVTDYFTESTHGIKFLDGANKGMYQLYQVSDYDLFYLGYTQGQGENIEPIDYYSTMTPIPLEFGMNFEGVITFTYEDNEEVDSIEYKQYYDVIGQGTMNIPGEGDVEMIKLAFTEEEYWYKDGEQLENNYDIYDELVWYSPDGHYIRAGIDEAYTEDSVELFYIQYQRLAADEGPLALTKQELKITTYPNPATAGEDLVLSSEISLESGTIQVVDISSRLIYSLILEQGYQVGTYQTVLPEDILPGVYMYNITNASGEYSTKGKVVIN